MASRLLVAGRRIVYFDLAGTKQRLPEDGSPAISVDVVAKEIVDSDERRVAAMIDTSTIDRHSAGLKMAGLTN
jgi:hypothetical protein